MKPWLLALPLLLMGASCPPDPPTPTPTPTPGPTINHPELLLRQSGGVLTRGGLPHKFRQCIPCWDPLEKDHGGWAGFSSSWVDYSQTQGGCNAYHMRLGPAVTDPADAPWAGSGGLNEGMSPYINDDAAQGFNQAWWDRALAEVRYAEDKGANVEIDLIDGWICKHAVWGDTKSPWSETDVKTCGNALTETHKAFIRKAVETFGAEAGVIWTDGNEIGATAKYSPQWTYSMQALVRQYEQEVGLGVVHMFGTGSDKEEVEASTNIDFTVVHGHDLITGAYLGKWRLNNERNPPGSPAEECSAYCIAEKAGQGWAYWRGAQSKTNMDDTLGCMKDCATPPTSLCPDPKPDPAKLVWKIAPSGGSWYDPTPTVDSCEYCKDIGMGDYNGTVRCNCPARSECPGFQCESRVACEQVLMQAPVPVWRSDGTLIVDGNGWRAKCEDCTWLEVCNGPMTNCRRAW